MVQEKFQEVKGNLVNKARYGAAVAAVTAGTLIPAMTAYASEGSGGDSGFLDSATMGVITDSVSKMVVTLSLVVAVCIPAAFTIMGLTLGAKFALHYVKGLIAKATAS